MKRLVGICLLCLCCLFALPAWAWKPYTHIYLAHQALKDATADGLVTIYKVNHETGQITGVLGKYAVRPDILNALRNYPEKFWAGCLGPDAYPDIATGQTIIHPPTVGGSPDDNPNGNPEGSSAWVSQLWRTVHETRWKNDPDLAFVLGFLAHGAGDVYAHTFVNYYTGGIFELKPNPGNALRHITLEGYLFERTPTLLSDMALPADEGAQVWSTVSSRIGDIYNQVASNGINGVQDYLNENLVNPAYTAELTALYVGDNTTYSIPWRFNRLRSRLLYWKWDYQNHLASYDNDYNAKMAEANSWGQKASQLEVYDDDYWIDRGYQSLAILEAGEIKADKVAYTAECAAVKTYVEHWISDIDDGLKEWLTVSHKVAIAMMFNADGVSKMDQVETELLHYANGTLLKMLGAPDILADVLSVATDPLIDLSQALKDIKDDIRNFVFKAATGMTIDEFKAAVIGFHARLEPVFAATRPEAGVTLAKMNGAMGLADTGFNNPGERFDWRKFPPAFNTVTLIKLSMITPAEMRRLLTDLGNTDATITFPDTVNGMPNNIMLGWIPSFDGSNQFVPTSSGQVPATRGLLFARSPRLYQQIFMKNIGDAAAGNPVALPQLVNGYFPNSVAYIGRGEEWNLGCLAPVTAQITGDTANAITATVSADSKSVKLATVDHIADREVVQLRVQDKNLPGNTFNLTVVVLPDLIAGPSNVVLYPGQKFQFTSNASNPHWVALRSGSEDESLMTQDGTFTAPMVTQATRFPIRCVEVSDTPATSVLTYISVQVLPPPPPIQVKDAANLRLKVGEKIRLQVTPQIPVTWKIVGDTGGASFGTLQDPTVTSAQSDIDGVKANLKTITAKVSREQANSIRARSITAPTANGGATAAIVLARQSGGTTTPGTTGGPNSGGTRTVNRTVGSRPAAVQTANNPIARPSVTVRTSVVGSPATFTGANAALPRFTTAPQTPALKAAQQDRDAFVDANRNRVANALKRMEDTLATLTAPAQVIKERVITVQATAQDGTGRVATAKVTLLMGGIPTAGPGVGGKPNVPGNTATPNLPGNNPPTNNPPNNPAQPNGDIPGRKVDGNGPVKNPNIPVGDQPSNDDRTLPNPTGDPHDPSKSAEFGVPYKYQDKFAVAILKAEYSIAPFVWGTRTNDPAHYYCRPGEKFLKVTMHVRNISSEPKEFGYQSIVAHAVSDTTSEEMNKYKRMDNGGYAKLVMQPGKELLVQGILVVPASGPVQKIVLGDGDTEFPLNQGKNQIGRLPADVSQDGVTVPEECPAVKGKAYPGFKLETTLVSVGFSNEQFHGSPAEQGKTFYVVTLKVKNKNVEDTEIHYESHYLYLYDENDDKYEAKTPYKATAAEVVTAPLGPDGSDSSERVIRYYFEVPKGVRFKRLTINEYDSRVYVYKATDLN